MSSTVFRELEAMENWALDLLIDLDSILSLRELPVLYTRNTRTEWRGGTDLAKPDKTASLFMVDLELPCSFGATITRSVGHPRVQLAVYLKSDREKSEESYARGHRGTDFPSIEEASAQNIADFISTSVREITKAFVSYEEERLQGMRATHRTLTRPYSPAQLAVLQRHELPSQVTEFLFSAEKGDLVGERGVEIDVKTAREEAYYRAIEWAREHPEVDQVELYYSGLTEATIGALKGLESKGLVVYEMQYNRRTKTYERLPSLP